MTLRIDDDVAAAKARIGTFLEAYYPGRGEQMTRVQAWYAGDASGAAEYLAAYAAAGVSHFVVRFTGDHEAQLEALAAIRGQLGWSSDSSIIAPGVFRTDTNSQDQTYTPTRNWFAARH